MLVVMDSDTGKVVAKLPAAGRQMTRVRSVQRRIYVRVAMDTLCLPPGRADKYPLSLMSRRRRERRRSFY